MSYCEVIFQCQIRLIIHVFVVVPAQMTGQVLSIQVIDENQLVEEILLTKITPRMRQYLCLLFCARVSLLNMLLELLNVVEPLFSDEYKTSF